MLLLFWSQSDDTTKQICERLSKMNCMERPFPCTWQPSYRCQRKKQCCDFPPYCECVYIVSSFTDSRPQPPQPFDRQRPVTLRQSSTPPAQGGLLMHSALGTKQIQHSQQASSHCWGLPSPRCVNQSSKSVFAVCSFYGFGSF